MSDPASPGGAGGLPLGERAATIALLVLDVDGVLTDGRLWYGREGEAMKAIDTRDGHGLVLLRHAGVRFATLSGRPQTLLHRRFEELGFTEVRERVIHKRQGMIDLAASLEVPLDQVAYLGDDVNDLEALEIVGLSACPADAADEVRARVDLVCAHGGGRGAVREVAELLLKARGAWPH